MLVMLVASCANASDSGSASQSARTAPAESETKPAEAAAPVGRGEPATPCVRAEARYLERRAQANTCERDDECAEIWPGPCPHGPYYAEVTADFSEIDAAEVAMGKVCEVVECEMPRPLGIASCEEGRCVRGRTPPAETADESCWDTRVTYLWPGREVVADAREHLQGITPLHAVGVPREGTLRLSARLGCDGCEPWVSEGNPGMASRMEGQPFTPEPRDPGEVRPVTSRAPPALGRTVHLEFPVRPGPYYIATLGGTGGVTYEVSLLDSAGAPMEPDRRGVVHLRTCEG